MPIPEAWEASAPFTTLGWIFTTLGEEGPERKGDGTDQKVHVHDDNRWYLLSISYEPPGSGLSPFYELSYLILMIVLGARYDFCSVYR